MPTRPLESHVSAARPRVTLARTDARDAQHRQVIARLDAGGPTTLMWGDAVTTEVEPGRHVLKANNTLIWKTVEFTVATGEHVEFQLINTTGRLTLGFLALLGVAPLYLTIEQRSAQS